MTSHAVTQIVEALSSMTGENVGEVRQALCDRLGMDNPPAAGVGVLGSPVPSAPAGSAHREMPKL